MRITTGLPVHQTPLQQCHALCAQTARVLRITARHWGMRAQSSVRTATQPQELLLPSYRSE